MQLADESLDQIFRTARTHNGWVDRPVTDDELRRLYEVASLGPTLANLQPMRLTFVRTAEGKQRLAPALMAGNLEKTMAAPVTAIVAFDREFYEHAPRLFPVPGRDMRGMFAGMPEDARDRTALMNGALEAGYLIVAARALGLDCGPMGGFDAAKVDAAFLAGTTWRTFMLLNLGHGDSTKLFPRNPRLSFDEAARLA